MPKPAAIIKKTAVRGSRTGRPIMALLDLLGRRWTLRIIWELRDGPLTSRALRTACDDASPTVMQARLSELREAGLIELVQGDGYRLTELGKDLHETFLPLNRFAERCETVAVAGQQFDQRGFAQLRQPRLHHRRRGVVAGGAECPRSQRVAAQFPYDAKRPAPAQEIEQGHDRPPGPGAANGSFFDDGGRFRHRNPSCGLLQIM